MFVNVAYKPLLHCLLAVLLLSAAVSIHAKAPKELYWEDLAPEDFVIPDAPPPSVDHEGNMTQAQPDAPLVENLDGEFVKIPGFVVPLEGDTTGMTEFLLVPYFGACIHVPPPPSNQIVYVKFSEPVPIDNLYDAIWVTGTLSTKGWRGDIASVGYRLSGMEISAF
ncbi:DUF3299 domain-containing protein [Agaribacter flavus]|uniref:DUF3299 domain-containing protein n=1 Tax=Agaribacter flavus TaxID=1902781 RepID=A0ABV7FT73_9ALTE